MPQLTPSTIILEFPINPTPKALHNTLFERIFIIPCNRSIIRTSINLNFLRWELTIIPIQPPFNKSSLDTNVMVQTRGSTQFLCFSTNHGLLFTSSATLSCTWVAGFITNPINFQISIPTFPTLGVKMTWFINKS